MVRNLSTPIAWLVFLFHFTIKVLRQIGQIHFFQYVFFQKSLQKVIEAFIIFRQDEQTV